MECAAIDCAFASLADLDGLVTVTLVGRSFGLGFGGVVDTTKLVAQLEELLLELGRKSAGTEELTVSGHYSSEVLRRVQLESAM